MRIHLIRGLMSSVMAILFFWGLARVPLAQGVALAFVAPLIALYLAALVLKEKIERRAIYASLLGFAGVLVILAAQAEAEMGPEAFQGAMSILASAVLLRLEHRADAPAGPGRQAGRGRLLHRRDRRALLPGLLALARRNPAAARNISRSCSAAVLGFGSLMLLSWAYARAEAQYLAPVEYTAFIWASLLGIVVFAEPVRPLTLTGAAMIVAACFIAARRRPAPVADVEAAI